MSVASFFRCLCQIIFVFFGVLLYLSASCCNFCIIHGDSGVPPHGCFPWLYHLVVIYIVWIMPSSLAMCCSCWRRHPLSWLLLLTLEPHHWSLCCWRLIVVAVLSLLAAVSLIVVVSIGFCNLLLLLLSFILLLSAASRCCLCLWIFVVVIDVGVVDFSEKLSIH